MKVRRANFNCVESTFYSGTDIEATEEQVSSALGEPSFQYGPDSQGKVRTEWDRTVDGSPVKVYDHHDYGDGDRRTVTDWSVEATSPKVVREVERAVYRYEGWRISLNPVQADPGDATQIDDAIDALSDGNDITPPSDEEEATRGLDGE